MSEVTCPHCDKQIELAATAHVPESQEFSMRLEFESNYIAAETVGRLICATVSMNKAIAKDLGAKIAVFLTGCEMEPKALTLKFCVAQAKA